MSDDEDTDIKDGVFAFYCATTDRSLKEMFPQCRQFDNLYFATSCLGIVENGQVQDWNNVRRNARECAMMEGAATKRNKPL
eukprot:5332002-Ditylum_brightwellii.AAC.1